MIEKNEPSRQELTEITSSTLDGVDAFIMSHETSTSPYGVEAVTSLAKGIAEAESVFDHEQAYVNIRDGIK
jgi:pyruvate kinase